MMRTRTQNNNEHLKICIPIYILTKMENDLDLSSIMVGYDEAPNAPVPAELSKKPADVQKPTSADANEMKGTDPSPDRQALILKLRLHFDTNPAKLKEIKPKK